MTSDTAPETTLGSIAQGDAPVLESLVAMHLDSLENSGLDETTYFLVRLAALVSMDAAPVSYALNLAIADEAGVTLEQAQGTLIAIAPIVGTARVAAAAGNILRAVTGAAALADADQESVPRPRTP
jgi:4-carboxymuconolactone decarboxylase